MTHNNIIGTEDYNVDIIVHTSVDLFQDIRFHYLSSYNLNNNSSTSPIVDPYAVPIQADYSGNHLIFSTCFLKIPMLYDVDSGNFINNVVEPFIDKFIFCLHFYYLDLTSLEISSLSIVYYSFINPTYSIFISIYMIWGCVVIWIIHLITVDLIMDLLQ